MIPSDFDESNMTFRSPEDLEGSCLEIKGYVGEVQGGIFDGSPQMIVAWMPTEEEFDLINEGCPIFLSVIGGLPPHRLCVSFEEAKKV